MSDDDPLPSSPPTQIHLNNNVARKQKAQQRGLFEIPPPLKRIFDRFPLVTYADNELPLGAPGSRERDEHVLYTFTHLEDAKNGRCSFNPGCLKWQTYLRFSGIPHRLAASSNHASPSGALPFLLPAVKDATAALPVPSNRLKRWIACQRMSDKAAAADESEDVLFEAYQSLLDSRIRIAWLYQLYLNPANASLLERLYVTPCSSNVILQTSLAYQLRQAAEAEIVKAVDSSTVVEADIMRAAEEALAALSTLLGKEEWFFGLHKPGLFDASVFAYTHLLLLDGGMAWEDNPLGKSLRNLGNLVHHRDRIAKVYY